MKYFKRALVVSALVGGAVVSSAAPVAADYVEEVPNVGGVECTIVGTMGNDVLVGTPEQDVICGLGGNDTIRGLGGDDVISGGPGHDVLIGGEGADLIFGDEGGDIMNGGEGSDFLFGGDQFDRIAGGPGYDECETQVWDSGVSFTEKPNCENPALNGPVPPVNSDETIIFVNGVIWGGDFVY